MVDYLPTIDSQAIMSLPRGDFGGEIVVIDSMHGLCDACNYLLAQPAIGFDTETRPSFQEGVSNRVALLQLSSLERCYLFRLSKMRLDKAIIKVLASRDVKKIGVDVGNDLRALQQLRHFRPDGFVDLQDEVGAYGIEDRSLRKMAAIILGCRISKAQRLSNWECATFTPAQAHYAATDAWVSLEMYNHLKSNR